MNMKAKNSKKKFRKLKKYTFYAALVLGFKVY